VSEYPEQPRPRGGWPIQPPRYTAGAGPDAAQAGYGQAGFGQAGYEQAGYGQAGYGADGYVRNGRLRRGATARTPRRRRGWIALVITLAVLAVLFFVADQVTRAYAQNMIAAKLQSSSGLATKPQVSIEGFPFLTQLAARDIGTIDISASNVPAGKLDIASVKAKATGVHLTSGFNGATIDHISGTGLITFADLLNAAGTHGVTITADPQAGPNSAKLSFGPLAATAKVLQTGPSQITVTIEKLPSFAASLIGALPGYTINVPKLPAGLQLQGVAVTDQGVIVKVAAQHTSLSQ